MPDLGAYLREIPPHTRSLVMTTNVGTADRIIRLLVAAVLVGLILTNTVEGTLAWVCGVGAAAALITAVFRFCGLYTILGISTCKVTSQPN